MDKTPLLSNRQQLLRQFRRRYSAVHSAALNHFYKPYSTNPNATGTRYQTPDIDTTINNDALNPFGRNTLFEGLAAGNSKPDAFESDPQYLHDNRTDVRTYGYKTPMTFVGPGYDIHGYPAPNFKNIWGLSGVYGSTGPSDQFRVGEGSDPSSYSNLLADVPEDYWLAGPVDMRWDPYRKVWTSRYGIYPGYITAVRTLDSTPTTEPQFRANIEYDAVINDGVSTGILVTGIRPRNYFPTEVNYKVYPLPTGWPCFIFDDRRDGRPAFSIMAVEPPYTVECSAGGGGGESSVSASYVTVAALAATGLQESAGGTGETYYEYQDILVGTSGHDLERRSFLAGTGIVLNWAATGILTVHLDPSIDFVIGSGVNFSITALSGLASPLSITQGGTGSSTKNFVDLSTQQTVAGLKVFTSGVRVPTGSAYSPGLAVNGQLYGLGYTNGYGLTLHSSGIVGSFATSGINLYQPTDIRPLNGYYPTLRVRQRDAIGILDSSGNLINHSSHIQTWDTSGGTSLAVITSSGNYLGPSVKIASTGDLSMYGEILSPLSTGVFAYRLPSQTGTLAIAETIYRQPTAYANINADYSVLSTDEILLACTGITLTLPNATTVAGRRFTMKDRLGLSATSNIVVTTSPTGQLIDDSHVLTLDINYVSYSVISDGSKYYLI